MKKKIFAFVIAALLLFILVPEKVCAEDKSDESEVRMLNDLLAYIYHREIICRDIKWILDSFEKFDRERTWESLQIARVTVQIAKEDIIKRKLPALEMTEDDMKKLINHKIDVSFLSNEALIFASEKTADINTCNGLNNHIMRDVFLKDDWAVCMRHVEVIRKLSDCNIKNLANIADFILTSINNPETTKKFNNLLAKHCPETSANQIKTPSTINDIEESTQKNLDNIDQLVMEKAKIVGAARHRLNLMIDAVEKQNFEAYKQNLMTISNMPPVIFSPEWFNDSEIFYFWCENDKIQPIPSPRSEITRIPDICRIKIEGVSLDKVKSYQQELTNNGLMSLIAEEANKFTIFCEIKESSFAIIWENEQVTIFMNKNPVCFMPILYLSLMK